MPKFNEQEKEFIRHKLDIEGKRLFTLLGLKKVTIDNLVDNVGIAKASFYTFYSSKEYLYMDIVQNIQQEIFSVSENVLMENRNLPSKERVKQVFETIYQTMLSYPILQQINVQTIEYLERKVSKERLEYFQKSNIDAVRLMNLHGIKFTCDVNIASLAFQSLYHCWIPLQNQNADVQKAVIDTMLNGIINQIVLEY